MPIFLVTSAHGGYGDREGKMLTQVITQHRALVTVIDGEVYGAGLDDRWDMLVQAERGDAPPGSE